MLQKKEALSSVIQAIFVVSDRIQITMCKLSVNREEIQNKETESTSINHKCYCSN